MRKKGDLPKIVLSCILMFSIGFEMGGFQAVLREISLYFSLGKVSMGMLVAVQYISIIIMPALFGTIADRFGKKRVLLLFMILFSLGNLLVGISQSLPLTIFSFFLIGAGYGVSESVCSALLSDQFGNQADRYMNLSQAFLCIGAVLAPMVVSVLQPHWRAVFIISTVFCSIAILMLFTVSDFVSVHSKSNSAWFEYSLFGSKIFLLLFFAMILYVGLESGFGHFTETHFHEALASYWGPYALSFYWGGMAVSRIRSSITSKNIQSELQRRFMLIALLFISFFISELPVLSLILSGAIGFAFGPIWSFIMSWAARLYPDKSAGVIGMLSSGCGLGGALFAVVMGAITKYTPPGGGFLFLSLSSLLAFLLILMAKQLKTPGKP